MITADEFPKCVPAAFIGMNGDIARVCAYHAETLQCQALSSTEATHWALARGWQVSHGICTTCAARELKKLRASA